MKKYLFILTALALVAISGNLYAQPEAEFQKIVRGYTVNSDGSFDIRYIKELKINSQIAFNRLYGETFVIYNPNFQNIKINSSYTKQQDGKIIDTPANAFNEVLPRNAADAPAYNHLRELVITHTGLETDCVIHLDYTIHTRAEYFRHGNVVLKPEIDEILQEQSPIKEYQIYVDLPKNYDFNYQITGTSARPVITEKESTKHYSWAFRNIPALSDEPFQPSNNQHLYRFSASCYSSVESILKNLYDDSNLSLNNDDEIFVKELFKNHITESDKIAAIQKYITEEIATCRLNLPETAYQIRPVAEILRSAYGTPAEKTMLLYAILRSVIRQPEIAVVHPSGLKVKGLSSITDMRVRINAEKQTFYLSATDNRSDMNRLGKERAEMIIIGDNGISNFRLPETYNIIDYKTNIKINSGENIISASVNIGGSLIPLSDRQSARKYIKNLPVSSGKIIYSQINFPDISHVHFYFTSEQQSDTSSAYLTYQLPRIAQGVRNWNMDMLNSERSNPLELPSLIKETYDYKIVMGRGMEIKTTEKEENIKKTFGELSISRHLIQDTLVIKKTLQLHKVYITPAEYPDFRKMMNIWNDKNNNNLIIKKED